MAVLSIAKKKIEKSRALTLEKMILIFSHRNIVLNCVYRFIHWSTGNFVSVHTSKCPDFFQNIQIFQIFKQRSQSHKTARMSLIFPLLQTTVSSCLARAVWHHEHDYNVRCPRPSINQTCYFESPFLAWNSDQLYHFKATATKEKIISMFAYAN